MITKNPLIIANWKMNGSIEFAKNFVNEFELLCKHQKTNMVLCGNYITLPFLKSNYFEFGAQDLSYLSPLAGSYTGEVSATQIYDLGARYVIIGHSERRTYFNESPEMLKAKVENALSVGLKLVFCVGEPLEIRNQGLELRYVIEQINLVKEFVEQLIIAYEPVWSIGGASTPKIEEIDEMHKSIKDTFANPQVIYGGAVTSKNSGEICALPSVDGLLVGRSSLDPHEFWSLISNSNK